LKSDGTFWTWGRNSQGVLGDGSYQDTYLPHKIDYISLTANVIIINNGATATNNPSVTLNLSAWDAISGVVLMRFSNDGVVWSVPEPYATYKDWTLTAGDGRKTIYAMFQDGAGNWSVAASAFIVLDTSPPVVTIYSPTWSYQENDMVWFNYGVDDLTNTTTTVKVDGVTMNIPPGIYVGPLPNGLHTFRVEATDAVGYSGSAEVDITVNAVFPTQPIIINHQAMFTKSTSVTLTLAAWNKTYMQFSNDGLTWSAPEPYATTKQWTLSNGDGTKTVYAMFQDAAGIWSTVSTASITLDTIPPIIINNGLLITNTTSVFLGLDAVGIAAYMPGAMMFSNDGIIWSSPEPYSGGKVWELTSGDGLKTVYVMFQDDAGRWYPPYSASIILDATRPVVAMTSPAAGLTNNATPLLSYTVSNGAVVVKVDGKVVGKAAGDQLDVLADGPHTVQVEATDSWGVNGSASVTFTVDATPPLTANLPKFAKLSAGADHSLAIAADGSLWAWGANWTGQLGSGGLLWSSIPEKIGTDYSWSSVSASDYCSLGLKSDGSLLAWGLNNYGALGNGTRDLKIVPTQIGAASDWKSVITSCYHTVALKQDGTLWAWGANWYGQLGDGFTNDELSPVRITGNWISVAAGGYHTVAVKSDGTLWTWGWNGYGQLGRTTTSDHDGPAQIGSDNDWISAAAGYESSYAMKSDGSIWSWGYNVNGELGDGTTDEKHAPVPEGTGGTWSSISVSGQGSHVLALKSDGTLWAWGSNQDGELGDGTTANKNAPTQIAAGTLWLVAAPGDVHSSALKSDGSIWSWGYNRLWELGDGTIQNRTTPHYIFDASNVIVINDGAAHTNSASVVLTLGAWDTGSGVTRMQFSDDGTTWTAPEPYSWPKNWTTSSGDAVKTVYAMFQDRAGNWSAPFSASITLDTTSPVVTITSPVAGATNNSMPLLQYTVTDGTVVVKVDGAIVNKISGSLLDTLADGTHTVRVEATDAAGNAGSAQVSITVDTTPPIVTIASPIAGTTNNRNPILMYTVSEGTVVVKVDGIVVNKVSGDTLNTLSDGAHTVRVEATNASGASYAEVTITVDTVVPTVTISSPTAGTTNDYTPLLIYSVSDGTITVKVDGGIVSKTSGDTLGPLANGNHTVRVEARDAASNTGYAEVTFTVDTASAGNDDTNIYCMGTGTSLVGPSTFTNGISVPSSNNIVQIASPLNYSTINGTKTIIKGAMDTTIPVNTVSVLVTSGTGSASYLAQVNGKYFAAQVTLSAGDNTITVTATDQNSGKHQTSVIVTSVTRPDNVTLQASPNVGIPTLKQSGQTLLDVALITTISLQNPVKSYAWDFNGSGTIALTCYSHSNVTASYLQTGLYLTTVTVTDSAGNHYTDTMIVNVVDAQELNSRIIPVWNAMRTALLAGDLLGALNFFTAPSKDKYNQMFVAAGTANISLIFSNITELRLNTIYGPIAEYWALRQESQGTFAYPVTFVQDENGNWKVMGF
jgi:alpha-tubulin suppressor-like RCC1 family protein